MAGGGALHDAIAAVLTYPAEDYAARLEAAHSALAKEQPGAEVELAALIGRSRNSTVEQMQELFTRTFDLNPTCNLEVGWHLFGENYERGTFLVWMRASLRKVGLPETTELPDHLTHVLPLLGRLDSEEANEFSATCVLPALGRMLDAFKGKDDPYAGVLRAIRDALVSRHGPARVDAIPLPVTQRYSESLVLLDGE